jgi:hypothetical protein
MPPDGCSNMVDCSTVSPCDPPKYMCGADSRCRCVPQGCPQGQGDACITADDGCGHPISCGNCLDEARIDTGLTLPVSMGGLILQQTSFEANYDFGCAPVNGANICAVGGITPAGGNTP